MAWRAESASIGLVRDINSTDRQLPACMPGDDGKGLSSF